MFYCEWKRKRFYNLAVWGEYSVFNSNWLLKLEGEAINIVLSWFLVLHESHEQRNSRRDVSSADDDTSLGVGFLRPNRVS